jgi:hypothetical protein
MKKTIIIVLAIVLAGVALWTVFWLTESETPKNHQVQEPAGEPANELSEEERGCINSGGTVTTASCCQSAGDFPDNCAIGACGCAPEHSHEVKYCGCGEEECFNGKECVAMSEWMR